MKGICKEHSDRVHVSACPGCLHREINALKRKNLELQIIIHDLGELLIANAKALMPITEDEARRMQDLLRSVE